MSLGNPLGDLPRLHQYMNEVGRDPRQLMVRGPLLADDGGESACVEAGKKLQAGGVTHINITASPELAPEQALSRLAQARKALAEQLG